jgi:predicted CDP-diglyceride synthetase/phosphatidate cytidylyltransferase
VLFAILSFAALREFMTLTHLGPRPLCAHRGVLCRGSAPVLSVWIGWYGLYAILIPCTHLCSCDIGNVAGPA